MLYCSKKCRTRANDSYHRTECRLWPFYDQESVHTTRRLAIRALLIGTKQGAKLNHLMNTLPIELIFAEKVDPTARKPFCDDYAVTLTLCRTFDQSVKSDIPVAVKAIIALRGLSFFSSVAKKSSVCFTPSPMVG